MMLLLFYSYSAFGDVPNNFPENIKENGKIQGVINCRIAISHPLYYTIQKLVKYLCLLSLPHFFVTVILSS